MTTPDYDARWEKRFSNYEKALEKLEVLVILAKKKEFDEIRQDALLHNFEQTQDLSWNVIRDFFVMEGEPEVNIQDSSDAYRLAFNRGLITSGQDFMNMVKNRDEASYAYNQEIADKVCKDIVEKYYDAFVELRTEMQEELERRKLVSDVRIG